MSQRTNRKTAATVTTYFVKVGKAPLRRLFLSIQLFLCFYFHLFLFMFAYLFCSCSPNSNPLSTHSTDREIPLTCYLLRPTHMSFFLLGRKPLVCGHKLSICIRMHSAFCPCWMSLVRHRWSDGGMWEAGFRAAGAQRLSGWRSVQRWNRTDGIKSFVWIALT